MKRLEHDSNTLEEVIQYFQTRARQLISEGFVWQKVVLPFENSYYTYFKKNNIKYLSIYITVQDRGKGLYKKILSQFNYPIITVNDCNIVNYLENNNIEHIVCCEFLDTLEYKMIQNFYADQKAERSKCFLMNHIDEGLFILNAINASIEAKKAFCIHPLVQDDTALKLNWDIVKNKIDPEVLSLAMEYRNIANAYLSHREIKSISDIKLSPIEDVNDMLIADKVQNYKDFLIYHANTHPRKEILDQYFKNWLQVLNISNDFFYSLSKELESIEIL